MIILVVWIVQTLVTGAIFTIGINITNKETKCEVDCMNIGGIAFSYDEYDNTCQCYDEYGDLLKVKVI